MAPICFMSHWRSASGSSCFPELPEWREALAPERSAVAGSNFLTSPLAMASAGARPITRFCATPSMARAAVAWAAKFEFVVVTVATPTSVFSLRTVPPAALIAACAASDDAPAAYRTTNSFSEPPAAAPAPVDTSNNATALKATTAAPATYFLI